MQFAALADRLGLLLVGVLAGDAPDVGYRLSRGQEIDEVLDTAGVAEFLDAGVRVAGRVHLRRLDRGGDCGRSRFGFTRFNGIFDGRVGRRGDVGSVHQPVPSSAGVCAASTSIISSTLSSPVSGTFSSMTVIRSPGTRKLVWRTRSMSCS